MGKIISWVCDVCGKQVVDNPVPNAQITLASSGTMSASMNMTFDAIICADCIKNKKLDKDIIPALNTAGKKDTSLIVVSQVTFKAINVDDSIQGIPLKT